MADGDAQKIHRPRPRKARGPSRPRYLESGDIDRVMLIVTSLMSEVSALRDRLDTHEALAAQGGVATREAVEAFRPDADCEALREIMRDAMLSRVLRVLFEDRDEHFDGELLNSTIQEQGPK